MALADAGLTNAERRGMADDALGAGSGDPAGESSEDGSKTFVPPKDGSWIPKVRFDEALNEKQGRIARLEAELAAARLQPGKAKEDPPPKQYSRAELEAAVAASQITQAQAEEIWAKQIREDAKREAKAEALGAVEAQRQQERIDQDLNEYKRLAPEIMEEGHETRQKIAEEFSYLVSLGHPGAAGDSRTLQTQLLAIRSVLGPIDRLKTARSSRRDTESHEETSGGSESRNRGGSKGVWDSLDKRKRDYYDAAISKGLYKDRAAVEAELKFNRKGTRARV